MEVQKKLLKLKWTVDRKLSACETPGRHLSHAYDVLLYRIKECRLPCGIKVDSGARLGLGSERAGEEQNHG
jgi:hypothetical protein